jgi:ribosome-binding factor A
MAGSRYYIQRLTHQLVREITLVLQNEINDPRVPSISTVTEVRLSSDTRNATVFVSILGDEKVKKGALIALNRAAPYIQRVVGKHITMKHFPRFIFKIDNSLERGERVEILLKEVASDIEIPDVENLQALEEIPDGQEKTDDLD